MHQQMFKLLLNYAVILENDVSERVAVLKAVDVNCISEFKKNQFMRDWTMTPSSE